MRRFDQLRDLAEPCLIKAPHHRSTGVRMIRLRNATHTPLARRLTSLAIQRRTRGTCCPKPFLARAFSHPQGAGVIGPGAQRLLRTVLVDALTRSTEGSSVVIARPDLERLLGTATSWLLASFTSVLHFTDTLEDTIEHLESRPQSITTAGPMEQRPILWLATPGADSDVVHQTLENQPSTDLITLFHGPWPYGPTHFIDHDGPRRLPDHHLQLLTRDQAVARLQALDSPA